jgi:hypothetical protein
MSISAKKADKQNKMISGGFHAEEDGLLRIAFQFAAFGMVIVQNYVPLIEMLPG